ncbi:MAG TPA: RcpC/CpaB family pilus assembly protein [bacterium]|nr:RcpC/CpaB family pilus assembly protein [bacterium]
MERASSNTAMRLGPLARRLLARRRRWLRWAAIAVAALAALSVMAQLGHRPAPRRTTVPVAVRGSIPAPRLHDVAAQVPAGMRAVNLIVPVAETFGGRLVPRSRVDVFAAFDVGQDRVVRRVLVSGIVLRITPQLSPSGAALPPVSPPADGRFSTAPFAEILLAVPASREREVVLAQAFGRVFVTVGPAAIDAPSNGRTRGPRERAAITPPFEGPLSLRSYLGLPPTAVPAVAPPALIPVSAGVPPVPGFPGGAAPRAMSAADVARGAARASTRRDGRLAVEVIEGTSKSLAEVAP